VYYKTVLTDSKMSDSDTASHETDEFTEEDDCEDNMDCFTQSIKPNDFLLLNSATRKTVKNSVWLIQQLGSDGYSTRFLKKQLTCWTIFFPRNWRECSNRSCWHGVEVTTFSGFRKQLQNSHYDFWHELVTL